MVGLSEEQRLRIRLELRNAAQYISRMYEAAKATKMFGNAQARAALETRALSRQTFLQRQELYTLRRFMFYGTIGAIGLAAAVIKMGFAYNNALQTTKVALRPVITDQRTLNHEVGELYKIAALSPFLFKDTVVAFRQMYAAFKPLGYSIGFTNQTIQTLVDSLSYAGRTSPAALNRVAVALQHMAYLGRPTGQVILQLARDGLPIYAALNKELGLSGDQIHNIAKSGITAKAVLQALNRYVATTPGFAGAAQRQANLTLPGAWQQFKDIISQASGRATGGLFESIRKTLAGVNNQLAPLFKKNEPITLTRIAQAFDKQLSPSTHLIINLFVLFNYTLKTIIATIWLLAKTVQILTWPLDRLFSLFGLNYTAMKLLGIVLGVSIALWAAYRTAVLLAAAAEVIATAATEKNIAIQSGAGLIRAIKGWRMWAFAMEEGFVGASRVYRVGYKNETMFARLSRTLFTRVAPGFQAAALASWEFTASLLANPITWAVVGVVALTVGLVLLVTQVKAVNKWLKENWYWFNLIVGMLGPIGLYISVVTTIALWFHKLADAIERVGRALHKIGGFLNTFTKIAQYIPGPQQIGSLAYQQFRNRGKPSHSNSISSLVGFRAAGGYTSGMTMVGERGPELLRLPSGSRVFNEHQMAGAFPGGMPSLELTIIPQDINLDGEKIGSVVAKVVTSRKARL